MAIKKRKKHSARARATKSSLLEDLRDVALAREMIDLDARLQVIQSQTSLSYDKILRLFHEVRGYSPPKGMLPFSEDWFLSWRNNLASTLFYSAYLSTADCEKRHKEVDANALVCAYRYHLEFEESYYQEKPILTFTRAWILVRFMNGGVLTMLPCSTCGISFVETVKEGFVCGVCQPPSRLCSYVFPEKELLV